MFACPPIGSICPFAGQVDPVAGPANTLWSQAACANSGQITPGQLDGGPLNHVEQQGWMLCDGRSLPAYAYPELYSVLGGRYGLGGTSTAQTFNIPDYRGLFLRGVDAGAGLDPDVAQRMGPQGGKPDPGVGSLQCDAMQDHTHTYSLVNPAATSSQGPAAGTSTQSTSTSSPQSPARVTTETRPRNVSVNYIIRFR